MPLAAPRIRPRFAHSTALPVGRRVGIWLGLFAMLAIYGGALVSQLREPASELPRWLTEMACEHGAGEATHHSAPAPWMDACGYCSLLIASPALGNTAMAAGLVFLPAILPARLLHLGLPGQAPLFPGARSRAPPWSS